MPYTVLIAEDEPQIRSLLRDFLAFEGMHIIEASNGEEAVEKFCSHTGIDLVLLDVMMPKMNGFEACSEIRRLSEVPILFLTALSAPENEIHGFELGADDYIAKPFRYDVLMVRVKNALKRHSKASDLLQYDCIKVDLNQHLVTESDLVIDLSPKEYDLLCYLLKHPEIALERQQILDAVWGFDFYGDPRTIDTHIKNLRNKLESLSDKIKTIRGFGYKLERESHV